MNAKPLQNILKTSLFIAFVLFATRTLVQAADTPTQQEAGVQFVSNSIDNAFYSNQDAAKIQNCAKKMKPSAEKISEI
jgi:hypothetical protein